MLKRTVFRVFNTVGVTSLLRSRKKSKLTVLNLHRVSPEKDFFFRPLPPGQFELLLKYVSKHYTVTTFAEFEVDIASGKKSSKPYLILSFDDGYYDFIEYALPLLIKYDLPSNHNIVNTCVNNNEIIWTHRLNNVFNYAMERNIDKQWQMQDGTIFSLATSNNNWTQLYFPIFKILLNTPHKERLQWISEREKEFSTSVNCPMMNWDHVKECIKNKVEIGSHTYHHDVLSTISDYTDLLNEIKRSKEEIENNIKMPVNVLALPNGQSNKDIEKACAEAGIKDILLVDEKATQIKKIGANKINLISRINIIEEDPAIMYLRTELFHSKLRKYV